MSLLWLVGGYHCRPFFWRKSHRDASRRLLTSNHFLQHGARIDTCAFNTCLLYPASVIRAGMNGQARLTTCWCLNGMGKVKEKFKCREEIDEFQISRFVFWGMGNEWSMENHPYRSRSGHHLSVRNYSINDGPWESVADNPDLWIDHRVDGLARSC